jgi:ATP-dependent Clp protease adaptor protein ClpS
MEYQHDLEDKLDIDEPKKYNILLLNDDFSTMEFVIDILIKVFRKSIDEATKIMLDIHTKGKAICGTYTHEIAQTKVNQVRQKARANGFHLKAIMEEI